MLRTQVRLTYNGQFANGATARPLRSCLSKGLTVTGLDDDAACGMQIKFLYDMVYASTLERFTSFLKTDLDILLRTPIVMFLKRTGQ